jgi:ketosteroid isomerase-like protein
MSQAAFNRGDWDGWLALLDRDFVYYEGASYLERFQFRSSKRRAAPEAKRPKVCQLGRFRLSGPLAPFFLAHPGRLFGG